MEKAEFKNAGTLDMETGEEQGGVAFDAMTIGGFALLNEAEFSGPVSFFGADIKGRLDANGSMFNNADIVVNLSNLNVGGNAWFRGANFEGEVDFSSANIQADLFGENGHFKKKAVFDDVEVGDNIWLSKTVFEGPVHFVTADVGIVSAQ